jgi:hypothetical protein
MADRSEIAVPEDAPDFVVGGRDHLAVVHPIAGCHLDGLDLAVLALGHLLERLELLAHRDPGGDRAAIAFTIFGLCRLAGVDPLEYLADVLPRLTCRIRLVDLPSLLPSRWAAATPVS